MSPEEFAARAAISVKEAKAVMAYLRKPQTKLWLKAFLEFELSPASRVSVYADCLFLMRDPPAGMWVDGSPMRAASKGGANDRN